jgi:hypothetical protein
LLNYILQAIQANLLILSSAAKEVNARINNLQAAEFIANSWQRVSNQTFGAKYSGPVVSPLNGPPQWSNSQEFLATDPGVRVRLRRYQFFEK